MYPRLDNQDGVDKKELEERATALLDRVLLMRVFDFVGVVEAVGEIWASLESNRGGAGNGGMEGIRRNGDRDGVEEIEPGKMSGRDRDEDSGKGRVGMILIDSMTNVVSSMMSKDHVQGQFVPLSPPPTLSSSMVSTSSVAALTNRPPTPRPRPPNHLPPLPPPPNTYPPPQHPPPQLRRRYATPTTFRQTSRRDKQRQYLHLHTG